MVFPVEARGLERRSLTGELLLRAELRIERGDRLAVRGPSGAGKTLILRSLAALDAASAGALWSAGRLVTGAHVPAYRARVLYLHQRATLFPGSVAENLALPFQLAAQRSRTFDRARAITLLGELGKPSSFLDKPHDALSGGEAQVTALVRALVLEPSVLLLDEPTSALDAASVERVVTLLDRWAAGEDRALVIVSHDDGVCRALGRSTVSIANGTLVAESA